MQGVLALRQVHATAAPLIVAKLPNSFAKALLYKVHVQRLKVSHAARMQPQK